MARIKIELPKKFHFSVKLPVRIGDVNYGGHLGNDRLLGLIHEARILFFKQFGYTELDVDGIGTIMTDVAIVYKAESFHGDELLFEITTADFTKFGFDFFYKITNEVSKQEIARAKTSLAFFDYTERRLAPIPESFLKRCKFDED